jgi:hypothetical protein
VKRHPTRRVLRSNCQDMSDLFQTAERCAWEVMQEQAVSKRALDLDRNFAAFAEGEGSLDLMTATALVEAGLIPTNDPRVALRNEQVMSAVREVYYDALHLGLLVPGRLDQSPGWGGHVAAYQFTARGLAFFRNGEASLSAPGLLIERVREVATESDLDSGIVPLAEEAQRCWAMGCLRASMVMIGLASEEVCTGLLDELCKYPLPPSKGDKLFPDWEKLNSEALSFYPRWQSGLTLLESVKQGLSKTYRSTKPDWWKTWEPFPGAIHP